MKSKDSACSYVCNCYASVKSEQKTTADDTYKDLHQLSGDDVVADLEHWYSGSQ
jgi:hypothetical protein